MNAPHDPSESSSPMIDSAGRWSDSLLNFIRTRIELFLLELEEGKIHLAEMLIWLVCFAVFALMFIAVTTVAFLYFLPTGWRGAGLIGLLLGYGCVTLVCLLRLKRLAQSETPMFQASLEQLKKDQSCFSNRK
ncbi:MAG: phage holin family protein [Verrucomicrobiota bacterium]